MTMPKLVVNSGGDEFFLPDDNYYFWDDLPGKKFLRLVVVRIIICLFVSYIYL